MCVVLYAHTTYYYIANVNERHGEFFCPITFLFSTKSDPAEEHLRQVQDWYDIELNETEEGSEEYWNDSMTYSAGHLHSISRETFMELKKEGVFSILCEEKEDA